MGKLLNDAQTKYTSWKASKNVNTMNESELAQYNLTDVKFKKAIEDTTALETGFYAARSEAFAAFEATKQAEFATLQTLWQSYEDNNMVVP